MVLLSSSALLIKGQTIYSVPGNIKAIKQPKSNDCWITVTTMMLSWRDGEDYSINEVLTEIGEPWISYFDRNVGLSFEEQTNFIQKVGLIGEPPANYMLEAYIGLLEDFGPLWITTGNGFSAHARLLVGINGDKTYEKSELIFINPLTGKIEEQSAIEFVNEFEREAIISNELEWDKLRIQIYHF